MTANPQSRAISLALALLAATACTPLVDTRGNMPPADAVANIRPGQSTRAQVAQLLGSPSNIGTFSDRTWYYAGKRTETTAFFRPETMEQRVVVIRFDESGVVQDVITRGLEDAKAVEVVDRETPTAGHSLGLIEQLFGNIGRFSDGSAPQAVRRPSGL